MEKPISSQSCNTQPCQQIDPTLNWLYIGWDGCDLSIVVAATFKTVFTIASTGNNRDCPRLYGDSITTVVHNGIRYTRGPVIQNSGAVITWQVYTSPA